ncbi:lytic transglycosylase domain-containing protein [Vibrio sp.]|uniref:lytic transglycosylase domain-containing protein n=1 Tax=Vibrio sp. TaxID=678 RepID=UPI00311D97EA
MGRASIQLLAILLVTSYFTPNYTKASSLASGIAAQSQVLLPYQTQIEKRLKSNQDLIHNIATKLAQSSLPKEFILIPMLESSYDPFAVSHAKAAGLWQLMPDTAKRFGLHVSDSNDQRFDVEASTNAAISYLQFLYLKFNDLALTLAAYNSGEGRVARAISKAKSREFSKLRLPEETRRYVHRFYALQKLISAEKLLQNSKRFYLFGHQSSLPLIDLTPLPPLVKL